MGGLAGVCLIVKDKSPGLMVRFDRRMRGVRVSLRVPLVLTVLFVSYERIVIQWDLGLISIECLQGTHM